MMEVEISTMSKEMPNGIDKKTVKEMDDDAKINVVIDYLATMGENVQVLKDELRQTRKEISNNEDQRRKENHQEHKGCDQRWGDCDNRFKRLERHKYAISGVLTFCAVASPVVVAWLGSIGWFN